MGREILLDTDGLVIRPRHKYFSEKFSEEYEIPLEEILTFFKGEFKKAVVGEVGIKEVLPDYLTKWGWKGTIDEFLQYWYEGEKDVDENILQEVRTLRQNGTRVHMVSDNEAGRTKYLMEQVGLEKEFDQSFFSSDLGITKSDSQFFQEVVAKLKVAPGEIEYWDDDPKNVAVAEGIGIKGHVYTDFETFKGEVET